MKNPAKYIDHTNIDPNATKRDIERTCAEAEEFKFRGVCVNPEWVKTAAEKLYETDIKLTVLIDPPMGLGPHEERLRLARAAEEHGADELDIVMNIVDLKYEREKRVLDDLKEICAVLPTKVIIGSGFLTTEEIKTASKLVKKAGGMCVKTSTFKDPLDHFELAEKARHVRLMKESAPGLKIKAAGKIRTFDDLKFMVDAGADIIGTSTSIQIVKGGGGEWEE